MYLFYDVRQENPFKIENVCLLRFVASYLIPVHVQWFARRPLELDMCLFLLSWCQNT